MNKQIKFFLRTICVLLMFAQSAWAVTCTSTSNADWTSGTWTGCATVNGNPPAGANVVIAAPTQIKVDTNPTAVANISVSTGATLTIQNNNTLTFTGNLTVNGTFTAQPNSTVALTGTNQTITGNVTFANLTLSAGTVLTLAGNIVVNGTLTGFNTANLASTCPANYTITNAAGTVVGQTCTTTTVTSINTASANPTNPGLSVTWSVVFSNSVTGVTASNFALVQAGGVAGATITSVTGAGTTWTVTANTGSGSGTLGLNMVNLTGITPAPTTAMPFVGQAYAINPLVVTVTMNPGTCVNATGIGATAWTPSPTNNVNLSDTLYATSTVWGTTNYLKCTGYGFAIPSTATILGMSVNVQRKSSRTTRTTDGAMRLVKAGVIGTVDRATATVYTTTDVYEMHGNPADMWGTTWTPADINSSTFGAAFAAKTTRSRTVSVNHMPITVTYAVPPATIDHIQIEHSGGACSLEQLTVKACANAACTSNFTTGNVSGNVVWAGTPGGTIPFTIASGGTGQVTVPLSVATAQTVTLSASAISPMPSNATAYGCTNLAGGAACSLPFSGSTTCMDAVEVGAAIGTPIYTKLSGTAFTLDVKTVAGANYTGTVKVELVNASTIAACAALPQLSTQNVTFSNVKLMPVTFNFANASRNTKVRMTTTTPATTISCSTDAFVIRPVSFNVTSSANADPLGASTTATPVVKAGANFSLTATAVAGYDGTPAINNALLTAHTGAPVVGLLSGAFGVANASGISTGSTFTYDEVGYFQLNAGAVTDTTFANLDALEVVPECTLDYSNTLVGGKYGCYIGNTAATPFFGRFVPDHFDTVVTDECGVFTYSGQPFPLEIQARAVGAAGAITQNYQGTFAKSVTLSDATNAATLGAFSPTSISGFAVGLAIADGVTLPQPKYTLTNVKTAPAGIKVRAVEATGADLVSSATGAEGIANIRSGRVWIGNAYGSELLPLPVPVLAQYWNGTAYVTNIDDSVATCTSFAKPAAITMAPSGTTTPNMPYVDPANAGNVGFNAGVGGLVLSKPSVKGVASVTLSVPVWLQYAWSGAVVTNPSGQATFGVYKGTNEFIYQREAY